MTFVREYGLVLNRVNPERYVRLVRWERRWRDVEIDGEGFQELHLQPVGWEYRPLDVSHAGGASAGDYAKLSPVVITEFPLAHWPVVWPSAVRSDEENEELRRTRIRALRLATHVDPELGAAEPDWVKVHDAAA